VKAARRRRAERLEALGADVDHALDVRHRPLDVEGLKAMLGDVALARRELGALVYEDPEHAFTAETVEISLAPIVASPERIRLFQELCDWRTNRAAIVSAAPALRASTIPAQVLWGHGDVVFDAEPSLEWLGRNLGGLRKTTIVPRGKLFFPEEHPRLVAVMLAEFWASLR
jgi:pimeloyl-ACP methyl ester carboxylesterase